MRNRFKGLDLIDRMHDELWNEVRDIVQETGIRTIPTVRVDTLVLFLMLEEMLSVFSIEDNLCCGFIIDGFYCVEVCSFCAYFLESFYH